MGTKKAVDKDALDLSGLTDLLGFQLRRAQISVFQHFSRTVGGVGITPALFGLMMIVSKNEGLSQSRLAHALGIDVSTMVAMIDRIEKKGWMKRQKSNVDRRSHALYLTKAGHKLLDSLSLLVEEHENKFFNDLDLSEKKTLLALLKKITKI
ncbi:MAG: MarR family transcriptional regulator [Alphaproteobacteria bacterium]|nr:MarR family transcriptional regulator [Alphaproteobacteria bacterium]